MSMVLIQRVSYVVAGIRSHSNNDNGCETQGVICFSEF
jgi:hypothetical protein